MTRTLPRPVPLLAVGLTLSGLVSATPDPVASLTLLGPDYPRAFFFRAAEGGPASNNTAYEKWDAEFSRLSGILGKCLDEEVVGRGVRNPEWFTRFKHEHPQQAVLLHFNGNARDPRFETRKYFPGHWIYRAAAGITAAVPATAEDTVIQVTDAGLFRVNTGRYRNANDDIALCGILPNGKSDWAHCEQVQLLAVDEASHTLRVKRGCYGTQPLAFQPGRARAAAHQTEGPWGKTNHLLWFYNFTTHCPQDPEGKTAADRLVEDLGGWFGPGGRLEAFDGLEFDVMHHATSGDTDGDGEADNGVIQGVNHYGIGMVGFARQLRERLGPNKIIQGDGALGPGGSRSQRAFGILNGMESEGWPNLDDWDFEDWSGGLNRLAFWHANAHPPAFSYINHKWIEPLAGKPGEHQNAEVPFGRHRLAFAAAQFTDAMLCAALTPPVAGKGRDAIWDEFICGTANQSGWLGKPEGPAIHLAAAAPDCLGAPAGEALAKRISGSARARVSNGNVEVLSTAGPAADLTFEARDVPVAGENLVVVLTLKGAARAGYPREMARYAEIGISGGAVSLMSRQPAETGMALRDGKEMPLDAASGALLSYRASTTLGGMSLPAYAIHPPYQSGKGYVFWTTEVAVPADAELRFHLGMGEKCPQRSDGVWFSVHAAPVSNASPGGFSKIFEESTKANAWLARSVSLAPWAGQRVRLKFVADCGPQDNATTDQGFWGGVKILRAGIPEEALTPPVSRMTWVNEAFFTSVFYFRGIRSKSVDLTFKIEGSEPVTLQRLTAHAQPDAMCRVFEHGLVLANPALAPYTFDLTTLSPGRSYRRFQATPAQDIQANNGEPAGPHVTLGPREGLFLMRQSPR